MQAKHSTHSAPLSSISGSASLSDTALSYTALSYTALSYTALSYTAPNYAASKCFVSNASISNSLMAHNVSRTPSIAGDVFAVVVWAAMVPCFMWLGNVMGL
jgi:hypothetical protein